MKVSRQMGNREYLRNRVETLQAPPLVRAVFGNVLWAWLWLIARLYVGWQWLQPGWEKLHDPAWTGAKAGSTLTGFIGSALTKTGGPHPDVQGWYAWFLQNVVLTHSVFWSYLIAWGETVVGVALIVGFLTGIAALLGGFMNFNYLMAGTVSMNPSLLLIAVALVAAWRIAGWWGLDRWVLPFLGIPWRACEPTPTGGDQVGRRAAPKLGHA
jgi:thiosulfate dehydrogenase [quinone] large subunit